MNGRRKANPASNVVPFPGARKAPPASAPKDTRHQLLERGVDAFELTLTMNVVMADMWLMVGRALAAQAGAA